MAGNAPGECQLALTMLLFGAVTVCDIHRHGLFEAFLSGNTRSGAIATL